jgi:hypothetical protein
MLKIRVEKDEVRLGERLVVSFQRTLRIPDDGQTYPLPPGLGRFPVGRVEDVADLAPPDWLERGGVFIPMYQSEALWLAFAGAFWKPNAVQIGVGGINAVTGGVWNDQLSDEPQNYIVCPDQPWLDGIQTGKDVIRQFVAVPLGQGYTVEEQITSRAETGGIQIRVFEPKPGRFPNQPPVDEPLESMHVMRAVSARPAGMGLAAGGQMQQKIYPDAYGLDVWDLDNHASLHVHIVNSEQYRDLTGKEPPPTPINAKTYSDAGFPWFALYDEDKESLAANKRLSDVRSVREIDAEMGRATKDDDRTVKVDLNQIKKIDPQRDRQSE